MLEICRSSILGLMKQMIVKLHPDYNACNKKLNNKKDRKSKAYKIECRERELSFVFRSC